MLKLLKKCQNPGVCRGINRQVSVLDHAVWVVSQLATSDKPLKMRYWQKIIGLFHTSVTILAAGGGEAMK